IRTIFTQGIIQSTNNPSDLAIQGEGFFILRDGSNTLYTRAGGFTLDANGTLVDATTGYRVQGAAGDIRIAPGSMLAGSPRTPAASQRAGPTPVLPLSVHAWLAPAPSLSMTFPKTHAPAPGQWHFSVATPDPSIPSPTGPTGSVTFDPAGTIASGATANLGVA